jgi:DNA-binding LytR/AlgR family response regulator
MKHLKCIIIDDEPLAQDVIKNYVEKTPFLVLQQTFENAWQLQSYLLQHTVDLLFLDIQMPGLDGLTFMKSVVNPPAVIFTTAYRDYAVEAFEIAAVDYLLKPISYDRFLKAVNKVSSNMPTINSGEADALQSIYTLIDRQMKRLLLDEILYLEAQGDYVKIYLLNEKAVLTKKTLREFITDLPASSFLQIHRSFVINKKHMTAYTTDRIQIQETWLKVSRSFKGKLNF